MASGKAADSLGTKVRDQAFNKVKVSRCWRCGGVQILNHQSRKTLKHINRAAETSFVLTYCMGGKLPVNAEHLNFLISGKQTVLSLSDLSGGTLSASAPPNFYF